MTLDEALNELAREPARDPDPSGRRRGLCGERADGSDWPFITVHPAEKMLHYHAAAFTGSRNIADASDDGIPLASVGRVLRKWVPDADSANWDVSPLCEPDSRDGHLAWFLEVLTEESLEPDDVPVQILRAGTNSFDERAGLTESPEPTDG